MNDKEPLDIIGVDNYPVLKQRVDPLIADSQLLINSMRHRIKYMQQIIKRMKRRYQ